jgi:uncharacterized membrane protein YhhN
MVWLRHPGWRPADVAARFPKPAFDVQQFSPYQPRQTRATLVLASAWFVLLLAATMKLLWHMDDMVWSQAATCVLAVSAGLWGVNTLLQNRISGAMCAFVQMAALTVASQVCGWQELFQMAKPLALLALMYVAWSASHLQPQVQKWLVRALGLSWVGDVLLLYPSMFLPGLVAFLAAHVCYIVLLSRDAPWLHSRRALAVFMSIAALVFVLLDQHGLPADLRVPVAAYVLVIATMAAQAWGRAKHLGTAGSRWLAWGSVLFMLSDTLLAVDKFVSPMPVAGLWVLTTYYLAQGFIVQGRLSSQTHTKVGKA